MPTMWYFGFKGRKALSVSGPGLDVNAAVGQNEIMGNQRGLKCLNPKNKT